MADGLDFSSLSPLIQLAIGGGIAVGSAIAIVIGRKKGTSGRIESDDALQGIYRVLTEMRVDNARYANERNQKADKTNDLLRDIKDRRR